jgi:hypothetical protein
MKFEVATSVLASLLMADPVLAQVAAERQKKERIMDSEQLQQMEDDKEIHLFQERNKLRKKSHHNDIHYRLGSRQEKERIMGSEHLEEMEGTNKLHHGRLHQRNEKTQTVPSHNIKTHDQKVTKQVDLNDESIEEVDAVTTPDVGILGHNDTTQALHRNLAVRRRRQPQNCFQEIVPIFRRKGSDFKSPICDQEGFAYWSIQDGKTFFMAGYCGCETECTKAITTHCCAKGCLACKVGTKPKYAKCGQFTAADF